MRYPHSRVVVAGGVCTHHTYSTLPPTPLAATLSGLSYELANVDGLSLEQIDAILANGGRFVVYEFVVSTIALTFQRTSKVWLVRDDAEARRIAKRYTMLTTLFGWWGLPFGPLYSLRAMRVNKGGGVDVTSDVRGALTEQTAALGVVRFEEEVDIYQMFDHVDGSDLRELQRCLRPVLERHPDIDAAWTGRIATEGYQPMHMPYAICLEKHLGIDEEFIAEARKALRKGFPKWVKFEFLDMTDPSLSPYVIKQCDAIYLRQRR